LGATSDAVVNWQPSASLLPVVRDLNPCTSIHEPPGFILVIQQYNNMKIPQKITAVSGKWVGHYSIAGLNRKVELGLKVLGVAPISPEMTGDAEYETQQRRAALKLEKMVETDVSRLAQRKLTGICKFVSHQIEKTLNS